MRCLPETKKWPKYTAGFAEWAVALTMPQGIDDKFVLFISKNNQYGINNGIFRDLPVLPLAYSTLAIINYSVYKWIVMKEISEEEMISMVLSFHRSLAIGLVKPEYLDRISMEKPLDEEATRCSSLT